MSDDIDRIRDDISFVRGLVEDDGSVLRASAIGLLVAGSIFGLAALRSFALSGGWLQWPEALRPLLPFDAPVVFFLVLLPILALSRGGAQAPRVAISSTSRTVWASWAAVGTGYAAAALSLSIAGVHAEGAVLFAFWGSGWFIAAAAYRRAWQALVSLGCYLVAVASGALAGKAEEQLLLGLALWTLVALPGLIILRQARSSS